MATEALLLLLQFNLVASAAIAVVMVIRPYLRRWFGPHQAYLFWWTVPIALAGSVVPPNDTWGHAGPIETAAGYAGDWLSAGAHARIVLAVWGAGVAVSLALVAWRYVGFLAQERSGRAGPAIVGILTPRLVTPNDFGARFTADERRLVRAHERAHIDRLDARCNAVALILQCLNWFNPLFRIGAGAMRFDQELACDATVMHRLPSERRRYAETLLHSHCQAASPLGCDWSSHGARLLMTRLTALWARRPAEAQCELGDTLIAVIWIAAFATAWIAQPPGRLPDKAVAMDIAAPSAGG